MWYVLSVRASWLFVRIALPLQQELLWLLLYFDFRSAVGGSETGNKGKEKIQENHENKAGKRNMKGSKEEAVGEKYHFNCLAEKIERSGFSCLHPKDSDCSPKYIGYCCENSRRGSERWGAETREKDSMCGLLPSVQWFLISLLSLQSCILGPSFCQWLYGCKISWDRKIPPNSSHLVRAGGRKNREQA